MIVYLASPYTDPDKAIEQERFEDAQLYVARNVRSDHVLFSPIVYCHELAKLGSMPGNAAFWFEFNFHMLMACDKVVVLQLNGWDKSIGVAAEIAYANVHGKPVEFAQPVHRPDCIARI